jgi:hypothetical protein
MGVSSSPIGDTSMATLFNRNGTEFTGTVHTDDKGKPFAAYNEPCSRCGGQGGSECWKFTGFVCYRCGGENSMRFEFTRFNLYTAEELTKLNTSRDAARERKAAKVEAERVANLTAAIGTMNAETLAAYDWAMSQPQAETAGPLSIAQDIASKVGRFGPLSEKQSAFLVKLHAQATEKAAEEAAAVPCPSGKVVVSGTVLTTKWVENTFGYHKTSSLKMLVKDARGFKVWGTAPSKLGRTEDEDGYSVYQELKGCEVEFTATVEPSADDKLFGTFSRPSKARIVKAAE